MNHCDTCGNVLPSDQNDYIEIWFHGRYGDMIKRFYQDRHLHFCSLKCFLVFSPKTKPAQVFIETRCYFNRTYKCRHPTDRKVCFQQTLICDEMTVVGYGELHQLIKEMKRKDLAHNDGD